VPSIASGGNRTTQRSALPDVSRIRLQAIGCEVQAPGDGGIARNSDMLSRGRTVDGAVLRQVVVSACASDLDPTQSVVTVAGPRCSWVDVKFVA
jgi:hypothetical protein